MKNNGSPLFDWLVFFVIVVAASIALLSGCRPPTPPIVPTPVHLEGDYPTCTGAQPVTVHDLCPNMFTPEFYACAVCRGRFAANAGTAAGCVEPNAPAYCANPDCYSDERCTYANVLIVPHK